MSDYYRERLQLRINEIEERLTKIEEKGSALINAHETEHELFKDRMQRNDTDYAIFEKILKDLKKEMKKNE